MTQDHAFVVSQRNIPYPKMRGMLSLKELEADVYTSLGYPGAYLLRVECPWTRTLF